MNATERKNEISAVRVADSQLLRALLLDLGWHRNRAENTERGLWHLRKCGFLELELAREILSQFSGLNLLTTDQARFWAVGPQDDVVRVSSERIRFDARFHFCPKSSEARQVRAISNHLPELTRIGFSKRSNADGMEHHGSRLLSLLFIDCQGSLYEFREFHGECVISKFSYLYEFLAMKLLPYRDLKREQIPVVCKSVNLGKKETRQLERVMEFYGAI